MEQSKHQRMAERRRRRRRPAQETRPESGLRQVLSRRVLEQFRSMRGKKALATALIVGGATVALATQVGAAEVAVGAVVAYVAYQAIRPGASLRQALSAIYKRQRAASAA